MLINKRRLFFIAIVIFALLICSLTYYFIFTTRGSSFITQVVLCRHIGSEDVKIKKISGNLSQTLVFQDIEFDNLKRFPQDNKLKIQNLEINLTSFSSEGLNIKIHNGQLRLPGFEVILFYGDYQDGSLNLNVYSNLVSIDNFLDLFEDDSVLKNLSGTLRNIDMNIKGNFQNPELGGGFHIEKLIREDFSITNCPGELSLSAEDIEENLKLHGQILLKSGVVSGSKTAIVNLQESKILFSGDPKKPRLDLKGTSKVGDIKITIALRGTFIEPDLKLTSQPPLPQERLLLMLATNKKWQGIESLIDKGELSAELAKDFMDYFVFSGSGAKIAQRFGLSDISVKYDDKTKGIGVKGDITDKAAASYSIEQPQSKEQKPSITHKIGAEHKISDSVSIGAEKELKQNSENKETQEEQKTDDKVIIKFKKEF